ncbi:hypothetical protein [Nonomuraea aurantiaca]|uniref:hypothetical protein n=1 Tax=Nonomuraea aurantiaca TaxID=2878562 RepID=UPI001CD98D18|nr:hypothetical protein [Nonomuraea aurantiaca]MCA2224767.1 hypothetical protein [Nonomuraea aurantiaca]
MIKQQESNLLVRSTHRHHGGGTRIANYRYSGLDGLLVTARDSSVRRWPFGAESQMLAQLDEWAPLASAAT